MSLKEIIMNNFEKDLEELIQEFDTQYVNWGYIRHSLVAYHEYFGDEQVIPMMIKVCRKYNKFITIDYTGNKIYIGFQRNNKINSLKDDWDLVKLTDEFLLYECCLKLPHKITKDKMISVVQNAEAPCANMIPPKSKDTNTQLANELFTNNKVQSALKVMTYLTNNDELIEICNSHFKEHAYEITKTLAGMRKLYILNHIKFE